MYERWNTDMEDFKLYYPYLADRMKTWYPVGKNEILVKLNDGHKIIYNYLLKTIKQMDRLPETDEEWKTNFCHKLRTKMAEAAFSQMSLSEATGISQVTISKYLNGLAMPSYMNVVRIADVLGCSITEFTYFD